jgi:hypothetical protein
MKMKARILMLRAPLAAALLCLSVGAHAHTDDWFDSHPAPHGGQVRMSGPYHLELVAEPGATAVYVTDHAGGKIGTQGWTAQAVVLSGGKTTRMTLKPAGDNTLRAASVLPAAPDTKVVLSVQPKQGDEYSARFTPVAIAKSPTAAQADMHGSHGAMTGHDHASHDHAGHGAGH